MIRDLRKNHEIVITCRPLANTIELLNLHGFGYHVIGKHYGANIWRKVYGYPIRTFELYRFLKKQGLDIAVSQSSFHSPLVSRLLGIKSIYMNDNEYAFGNVPAFLFADVVMVPEFLDIKKVVRQGATPNKIIQYPGIKEGIYLWDLHVAPTQTGKIYIRPEPWTAQYYKGKKNFLTSLLLALNKKADIVLLPRDKYQADFFIKQAFQNVCIQTTPLTLTDIAGDCSLFIGAGGTMTRELAFLGIPTISVYQDDLLDVDNYLLKHGYMIHRRNLDATTAITYMQTYRFTEHQTDLREKGRRAYAMIKDEIERLGAH